MPWLKRRNKAAWLEVYADVCSKLNEAIDQDGLLKRVVRTIKHSVNATRASVLLPTDGQYLRMTSAENLSSAYVEAVNTTNRIPIQASPSGQAHTSRKPVVVGNAQTDTIFAPWRGLARSQGYRSVIMSPLVAKERSVGVLCLYSDRANNFARHSAFIEQVSQPISTALDRINLLTENFRLLDAMVRTIDLREQDTGYHSQRVAYYTVFLAALCGRPRDEWEMIYWGALLHDVGKIGVLDRVLLKESRLSDEEWLVMKQHPEMGYSLVKDIQMLGSARHISYSHHEKWDGSGYPQGLKGEAIPLIARIFAVADALDVITSHRPYKRPYSFEFAHHEIMRCSGAHFDPSVVEVFAALPSDYWHDMREAFERAFSQEKPAPAAVLELVEAAIRLFRRNVS